ncbi:MAG: hypothetical protein QOK37_4647 [Thermoanaerobaculia bacterium]|nr:hypothetical protein [Thermoanaerobaculia bacterium]
MAHAKKRLKPDYANTDPFRGLPPNFPTMHSRFPPVPSERYSEIPVVSEPTDDAQVIGDAITRSKAPAQAKRAWRAVARRVEAGGKRTVVKA